jgi:hypothetical protein
MDIEKHQEIQSIIKKIQSISDGNSRHIDHQMKSPKIKMKQKFSGITTKILLGAVIGVSTGLLLTKATTITSLEAIGLSSATEAVVIVGVIGASLAVTCNVFRKSAKKTIDNSEKIKQPQPEKNLSASKNHPLINTLVYKDSINDFNSETFNQDRMLTNAEQILATMDHTTASMH